METKKTDMSEIVGYTPRASAHSKSTISEHAQEHAHGFSRAVLDKSGKKKGESYEREVSLGSTQASITGGIITFKGPKGEVHRKIDNPLMKVEVQDGKVFLSSKKSTKNEKKIIGTFTSHLKNCVKGVTEGFIYKLKICSGHFPITVTVKGKEFSVKNFLGESYPRTLTLKEGVEVKINGTEITVYGVDLDLVSQTAASFEKLCRITNRDLRVFQDGIYIVEKDGISIA